VSSSLNSYTEDIAAKTAAGLFPKQIAEKPAGVGL
jgi:hypothetical protein